MHFAWHLRDSGRIGLNLHFKGDVKSGLSIRSQGYSSTFRQYDNN